MASMDGYQFFIFCLKALLKLTYKEEVCSNPICSVTSIAGSEDIIRKHKMGCLRITSLLCCNNRLWIGTSAGILINTLIPNDKLLNWTPTLNGTIQSTADPVDRQRNGDKQMRREPFGIR